MTSSPGIVYDVRDFGAASQGLASPAINAAIQACAAAGGGTVWVPAGTWRCGTVQFASNVCLYLSAGAVLQSSLDLADFTQVEGMLHGRALIAAHGCQNVSLAGEGCIDGRGPEFMDWTHTIPAQGRGLDDPMEGAALPKERLDRMIYFDRCKNVQVSGLRLREAAGWCLNLVGCEDVWCTNLDIYGHERIPNNDGIHLCYCHRATIQGCHIHSGDDAIALTCIKGGTTDALIWSEEELQTLPWCEDITISDCILNTRGSGVRIGFMDDFVRRVCIHDCLISDCQRGFLVSARNNGRVEDIKVHDCRVEARLHAGVWWGGAEPFQISGMGAGSGQIQNIEFRNVEARSEHGVLLWPDQRFPIRDVRLKEVRVHLQNSRHADTLGGHFDLRPRSVERDIPSGFFQHEIPGIYAQHLAGLQINGCQVTFPPDPAPYFRTGIHTVACPSANLCNNQADTVVVEDTANS